MSLKINGADVCAQALESFGVNTIFCITGAGNLAIVDALARSGKFQIIYSHHEQAAVMEAQGYSRITGKPGVALVTTGGGAANAVTGVLSAHLDSIPLLVIAGNESSFHCENMSEFRAYGVQGFDSQMVMNPITKSSIRILDESQIGDILRESWVKTTSGRPGPVFVEFPMDLQRRIIDTDTNFTERPSVVKQTNSSSADKSVEFLDELVQALNNSIRPILYFGNGIRNSTAHELAKRMVSKCEIPFILSWSAIDLFEDSNPLNIGRVGLYGDRAANILIQQSDLVLCVGTRLAIPQVGYDKNDFARRATKWVVDIDGTELTKFPPHQWSTHRSSSADFLDQLLNHPKLKPNGSAIKTWLERITEIKAELPRNDQVGPINFGNEFVHSAEVIECLNQVASEDAIFVTDVGAGLLTGHNMISIRPNQRMFTSQGLGEMGFGLPGAIGAYFAGRNSQLICLNTDGGMMFNIQELQVIKHHKIPIKLFVFNNDGYGMIKISQDNLFDGRYAGSNSSTGVSCANFEKLANLFDLDYLRVDGSIDLSSSVASALANPKGIIIEVMMSPEQKYYPRLATAKLPDGSLVSPPLEDLDPLIPIDDLEKYLGYKPTENSFQVRGIPYGG